MQKIDFTVDAEEGQPFSNVKVGQELYLNRQEDGSWCCSQADGAQVCRVPPAAAASLAQHHDTAAAAVIRSVKRCHDNPDTAVSLQVRVSFPSQGKRVPVGSRLELQQPISGGTAHCCAYSYMNHS